MNSSLTLLKQKFETDLYQED